MNRFSRLMLGMTLAIISTTTQAWPSFKFYEPAGAICRPHYDFFQTQDRAYKIEMGMIFNTGGSPLTVICPIFQDNKDLYRGQGKVTVRMLDRHSSEDIECEIMALTETYDSPYSSEIISSATDEEPNDPADHRTVTSKTTLKQYTHAYMSCTIPPKGEGYSGLIAIGPTYLRKNDEDYVIKNHREYQSGSYCKASNGEAKTRLYGGIFYNPDSKKDLLIYCPVRQFRDQKKNHYYVNVRLNMIDNNPNHDVFCILQTRNKIGVGSYYATVTSAASNDEDLNDASNFRTVTTPYRKQSADSGYTYIACYIPPASKGKQSGLVSYGILNYD